MLKEYDNDVRLVGEIAKNQKISVAQTIEKQRILLLGYFKK